MKRYEIRDYFYIHNGTKTKRASCQHCGKEIHWREREHIKHKTGKYADYKPDERYWWTAYSKAAYKADADYEVLCRECYQEAVKRYGPMISREEMLRRIDESLGLIPVPKSSHNKHDRLDIIDSFDDSPNNLKDYFEEIAKTAPTQEKYAQEKCENGENGKKDVKGSHHTILAYLDSLIPLINTALQTITVSEIPTEKQNFLRRLRKGSSFSYDMTSASWGSTQIYAPWGASRKSYVEDHDAIGIMVDIKRLRIRELALEELVREGYLQPIGKDGNDKLSYCVHCRDGKRFITIPFENAGGQLQYDRFLVLKDVQDVRYVQNVRSVKNVRGEE